MTIARWTFLSMLLLAFIMVPFALMGAKMDGWSVAQLNDLGQQRALIALFIIALLASDVLLPVPSSIVATMSGALLGFQLGALTTFIGMTAGCVLAFAIGRYAAAPVVEKLVGAEQVSALRRMSEKYGNWTLVVARPVPVLAEASTLMAGATRMEFTRFMAATSAANLGVALAYAAVGAYAANVQSFLLAFAGAILIPAALKLVAATTQTYQRNRESLP